MTNRTFLSIPQPTSVRTLVSKQKSLQRAIKTAVLPEVLLLTSYPPRECGIATYSQDLIKALNNKFEGSFALKVCALQTNDAYNQYPEEVAYTLNTNDFEQYIQLANDINDNSNIELVLIQHEFGFFHEVGEQALLQFLYRLTKPVIIVFHTVLPKPDAALQLKVKRITKACVSVVVMTRHAATILTDDYEVLAEKIEVIAHGTHLVPHLPKAVLKEKYGLTGKKVLATFGLLSSGKSIETTLDALPAVIVNQPDIIFLIIGKTHPSVKRQEGEQYRDMLKAKIAKLRLHEQVKFVDAYLPLSELLEYLQMTDIYLFTSKDPHQAVSGTFSYAMSCGCPIISTPIPHAVEVLKADTGIFIDFQSPIQLASAVNYLLSGDGLIANYSVNTLQNIAPTVWENAAIAHALLLKKVMNKSNNAHAIGESAWLELHYRVPALNLDHVKKMTTEVGIIQFSVINQPDMGSGYTLDDNARALVAICMHYEQANDEADLPLIQRYLHHTRLPTG
jgi:glycosyltransferase involved in cell wall biosynthesis